MKRLVLLAGCFALTACLPENNSGRDHTVEISALEHNISYLQGEVNRLKEVNDLHYREISRMGNSTVELSPATKDFAISRTEYGHLYFSIRDVKKYANGHKVYVQIGNPHTSSFQDVVLKIRYNKAYETGHDFVEWLGSIKETSYRATVPILAGFWTTYEVVLSPSTDEETGWIEITPEIKTVILKNNPQIN